MIDSVARPTARVLALLELLQSGGVRPVRELAERLEVDERTVRRYAEHLVELGIPVETVRGRYGGYRVGAGYRLPPLMLTDEEALATVLALAGRSGAAAETASAKLRRVLPPALARRLEALLESAVLEGSPASAAPTVLLTVAEAAHDGRPVVLDYADRAGAVSTRTVLPWGLVAHEGRWYVTGPDSASGEHRTFRIDRIRAVRVGEGRFRVPADFDPGARVAQALARTPWRYRVEVLVRASEAFIRTAFPAGVALVDDVPLERAPEGAAGWSRVRLRAERLGWVAGALAGLDVPFVVVEPEELRAELLDFATRLSARARSGSTGSTRSRSSRLADLPAPAPGAPVSPVLEAMRDDQRS